MDGLSKLLKQKIDFYLRNMTLDILFFDQISQWIEDENWRSEGDPPTFINFVRNTKKPYKGSKFYYRRTLLQHKYLKITRILNLQIRKTFSHGLSYLLDETQVYRFQDFLLIQKDVYQTPTEEFRLDNFDGQVIEMEELQSHLSRVKIIHLTHFDYRTLLNQDLSVKDYLEICNYFQKID